MSVNESKSSREATAGKEGKAQQGNPANQEGRHVVKTSAVGMLADEIEELPRTVILANVIFFIFFVGAFGCGGLAFSKVVGSSDSRCVIEQLEDLSKINSGTSTRTLGDRAVLVGSVKGAMEYRVCLGPVPFECDGCSPSPVSAPENSSATSTGLDVCACGSFIRKWDKCPKSTDLDECDAISRNIAFHARTIGGSFFLMFCTAAFWFLGLIYNLLFVSSNDARVAGWRRLRLLSLIGCIAVILTTFLALFLPGDALEISDCNLRRAGASSSEKGVHSFGSVGFTHSDSYETARNCLIAIVPLLGIPLLVSTVTMVMDRPTDGSLTEVVVGKTGKKVGKTEEADTANEIFHELTTTDMNLLASRDNNDVNETARDESAQLPEEEEEVGEVQLLEEDHQYQPPVPATVVQVSGNHQSGQGRTNDFDDDDDDLGPKRKVVASSPSAPPAAKNFTDDEIMDAL